jgi:hypothetical protein
LNKQIAAEFGTVEKTVKVHRARMMAKLGVRNVPELVYLIERVPDQTPPLGRGDASAGRGVNVPLGAGLAKGACKKTKTPGPATTRRSTDQAMTMSISRRATACRRLWATSVRSGWRSPALGASLLRQVSWLANYQSISTLR